MPILEDFSFSVHRGGRSGVLERSMSRQVSATLDRIGLFLQIFLRKSLGLYFVLSAHQTLGLYAHMPLSRAGQFCQLSHDEGFTSSEDSLREENLEKRRGGKTPPIRSWREENPQISDHTKTLNFRAFVTKFPRPSQCF